MTTFRDFLRWYNNKDVVPTLGARQKMIEIYQEKEMDMLKPGCRLPNLANICLHKSTDYKFYPFFSSDSDLHEKKTGIYDRWALNCFHKDSSSK